MVSQTISYYQILEKLGCTLLDWVKALITKVGSNGFLTMQQKESKPPSLQSEPWAMEDAIAEPAERTLIGSSLVVKGDLVCEEALTIQGRLAGKLSSTEEVSIGETGCVRADINAKAISIEGEVEGNLYAEEKIVIHPSGNVKGNLSAPGMALEDGCKFKGHIETIDTKAKALDQHGSMGDIKLEAGPKKAVWKG